MKVLTVFAHNDRHSFCGGVLDRFDSLLFVLPVAYVLFNALLVWAPPR